MLPSSSVSVFQDIIAAAGKMVDRLAAADAVEHMLAFYRDVRAAGCMEEEGDMLLFQWGTYDWGQGQTFQFDLRRQFIQPGDEDEDGMSQFALTLHYAPEERLLALGNGDQWCESPAGAGDFRESILASEAYRAVVLLGPKSVEVEWTLV